MFFLCVVTIDMVYFDVVNLVYEKPDIVGPNVNALEVGTSSFLELDFAKVVVDEIAVGKYFI